MLGWARVIRKQHYELILDLQTNWVSRAIRRASSPRAWGEFDRTSAVPAGTRVLQCFQEGGFSDLQPDYSLPVWNHLTARAESLLVDAGWEKSQQLIMMNPAGLWVTRNWPLENYVELARLFLRDDSLVRILLLGTERMADKATMLSHHLGDCVINLVGKTALSEALAILGFVSLAVSEDSGLMHMAWATGVPTIALFGSTRHDRSAPVGSHARCLHSGDLPCGDCMDPTCRFGDVHCLTRYSPDQVYEVAQELLKLHKPQMVAL
jgi:ADP-heptose:LPS heptosyltransferase